MQQHENLQYVTGLETELNDIRTLTCIFVAEDTGNIYIVRKGESILINADPVIPVVTGFTGDIVIAETDELEVDNGIIVNVSLSPAP